MGSRLDKEINGILWDVYESGNYWYMQVFCVMLPVITRYGFGLLHCSRCRQFFHGNRRQQNPQEIQNSCLWKLICNRSPLSHKLCPRIVSYITEHPLKLIDLKQEYPIGSIWVVIAWQALIAVCWSFVLAVPVLAVVVAPAVMIDLWILLQRL